jgi:hypothetical protein
MSRFLLTLTTFAALLCGAGAALYAQLGDAAFELEQPAIDYSNRPTTDRGAALNRRLQTGEVQLRLEPRAGYLRSLLDALEIPVESQIAVFSKTSLQAQRISPTNPRTIFFNDSVSVAWMHGGFIEVAAHDPQQGAIFYRLQTLSVPRLVRDNSCLGCHFSVAAQGVPGFLVRSIPTAIDGATMPWLGNYTSDHRSPLPERWGGWYVTGQAGSMPHLGNAPIPDRRAQELPVRDGRPLLTLTGLFDTSAYLSPHSDIVALLVFGHQMKMMNLLTRLGWEARVLAHQGRPGGAETVLRDAAVEVVDYLLFVDEAPLGAIRGTSGYAEKFTAAGRRDRKGRSLRDLDLQGRLLRYPCSYMIYSEAFDSLPADAKGALYRRMWQVLSGEARGARYARLAAADRQAILEILRDTKQDLPPYWFLASP